MASPSCWMSVFEDDAALASTSAMRPASAASMPKPVRTFDAMSAAVPRSVAVAAARASVPGMAPMIWSVSNPAMPRNVMPSAASDAENTVVRPSSFAVSWSLAKSSPVAPVIAETFFIEDSKSPANFKTPRPAPTIGAVTFRVIVRPADWSPVPTEWRVPLASRSTSRRNLEASAPMTITASPIVSAKTLLLSRRLPRPYRQPERLQRAVRALLHHYLCCHATGRSLRLLGTHHRLKGSERLRLLLGSPRRVRRGSLTLRGTPQPSAELLHVGLLSTVGTPPPHERDEPGQRHTVQVLQATRDGLPGYVVPVVQRNLRESLDYVVGFPSTSMSACTSCVMCS